MLISIPLFAQETEVQYNQTDEQGRKQGAWQKYHPGDSVLRYKGHFKDDQPYGKFTHYFINGMTKVELTYNTSERSLARTYYPDET